MIKKAEIKDINILANMAMKIWDNTNIEELEKEFEEILSDEKSCVFIKFVNNKAVGFSNGSLRYDYVEGCDSSPVGYLEGIYIDKKYRLKGYARDLVNECEKWAKDKGCKEFASDCILDNKESLIFHLSIGFNEVNRIICFNKKI